LVWSEGVTVLCEWLQVVCVGLEWRCDGAVRVAAGSRPRKGDVTFLLRLSHFSVFITHFLSVFYLPAKYFNSHL